MSDIPRARGLLQNALAAQSFADCKCYVRSALLHMTREQPEFMTRAKLPPLTREQVKTIRRLRAQEMPMNEIARKLNTNIGRVSEAINGKRSGI